MHYIHLQRNVFVLQAGDSLQRQAVPDYDEVLTSTKDHSLVSSKLTTGLERDTGLLLLYDPYLHGQPGEK